ncbi:glycerol-3-phosphate dehydrogenase [NAD(+)], cytoplasmic-like isoform X2 [Coccinella septempunctata]|uniref:glycerol-3-phosphate dehydrogenase [NAD(+)], cytoplasmic-like isoform X2 n=1 Tax=Coccinella septempunctata TaxID=41139 RepID=UPI001D08BE5A|nr:glycerol-3-phosphate dehydrogenase [NAD(+)], cytoplasmic-like isoform X2 [Coccinella septempunctata]
MDVKKLKRVCVLGSGGWGSVIARIVARNVLCMRRFHPKVTMYVFEEFLDGRKLTEIINKEHENVKYCRGYKFTNNLIALSDPVEAAKYADYIIFVTPHQFVDGLCKLLYGKIKKRAVGVSLIKGFEKKSGGGIDLISHIISKKLAIPCHVLMGANIASEVVAEIKHCTSTLGCKNRKRGEVLKDLFETDHLKISVVADEDTVEICGALKNIVATGVGFVDGLGLDNRMKEAMLRLGFMEMMKFVDLFYPGGRLSTFFESCGIADLIVTSFAGRNRKCAAAFVTSGKTIKELEKEMLNGQMLQGPPTAEEVTFMLRNEKMTDQFPLFTVIDQICRGQKEAKELTKCIEENILKKTYPN